MMFAIFIIYIVLIISLVIIGTLFYFLDKRLQTLAQTMTEQLAEIRGTIELLKQNCGTLRENDDILAKDLETLLHEFKKFEKKVKRES